MRKDQIEATKQEAIELLKANVSNQINNKFWTLIAEELGIHSSIISGLKTGTRIMTLERALEIIDAVPRVLEKVRK